MIYFVTYGTRKGAVYHEQVRLFENNRSMLRFLKTITDDEEASEFPKYHLLRVGKAERMTSESGKGAKGA